jgi:two-component system, NtrC family, sensor kinase
VNLGRVFARILEDRYQTQVATSGREGLDLLLGGTPFDVILCDLMMRDVTGMDVHAELKKRAPGLEQRLVLMTGGAFTPRARQFLAEVPNARYEKPFDLTEAVATALAARGPPSGR